MVAYHGEESIKQKYVARMQAHIKADELVRGATEGKVNGSFRGCAVTCTLDRYDHKGYETELGIPEWLARLEDTLFENMSIEKSKTWPLEFLKAIRPGVNLEPVRLKFLVIVLEHAIQSVKAAKCDRKKWPQVAAAVKQCTEAVQEMIRCHQGGYDLSAAESAARSAESAAWSAAESAARSAESAAWSAASAARSAARSAASAAASAAWSAESAAWSAASAAWSAASAAWSAASAAASAAYDYYADELIKILQ